MSDGHSSTSNAPHALWKNCSPQKAKEARARFSNGPFHERMNFSCAHGRERLLNDTEDKSAWYRTAI